MKTPHPEDLAKILHKATNLVALKYRGETIQFDPTWDELPPNNQKFLVEVATLVLLDLEKQVQG